MRSLSHDFKSPGALEPWSLGALEPWSLGALAKLKSLGEVEKPWSLGPLPQQHVKRVLNQQQQYQQRYD
jgi:hypothetical protein